MAIRIQLRQGTTTEHNTFTGAVGEVTVDTTNKTLRVHDGSTAGGTRLATLTGGLVPVSQLPDATTSVKGAVVLNNTLTSTSTTQALTAAQGKVLGDRDFGVVQTWQDVTGSRSLSTTYTNTTGRPISVSIDLVGSSSGTDGIRTVVGGVTVSELLNIVDNHYSQLTFIVPIGQSYSAQQIQSTVNLTKWMELR